MNIFLIAPYFSFCNSFSTTSRGQRHIADLYNHLLPRFDSIIFTNFRSSGMQAPLVSRMGYFGSAGKAALGWERLYKWV